MTTKKKQHDAEQKADSIRPARVAGISRRRRFFDPGWVVDNTPYLLFLCMLALVYIYNGHHSEKRIKDINRTATELRELEYEYKTVKSELMFREKQSEVAKAVFPFGLKEPSLPPFRLTDTLP
ncbi:MAG: hypothetical protein FJX89_04835 [Bacteroidetes bacterium]|nr:hypothetical protein [Bacteroidota bacterium]